MLPVLFLVSISCGGTAGDGDDGGDVATTVLNGPAPSLVCEPNQVDGDLFLYNWADYVDPDLVSRFETEFDVEVIIDTYESNEALLAKLQSGAVYDLVVPSDHMVITLSEQELLAPLQARALPNIGNLMSRFRSPSYDPDGTHSVAYQWGTTGLGVDPSLVDDDLEASWSLIFDVDTVSGYPGGIVLSDDARETMGAALKYLGYSLNSTREAELQEAADLIAGVSEYISMLRDDDTAASLLNDGVTVAQLDSKSRSAGGDDPDEEAGFIYIVPREGASLWVDAMAVPVNAEHPCTAHAFINFILDAENGGELSNWNRLATPNRAAEQFVLPELLEDEAIYPPREIWDRLEIISDTDDLRSRYDEYLAIALA